MVDLDNDPIRHAPGVGEAETPDRHWSGLVFIAVFAGLALALFVALVFGWV